MRMDGELLCNDGTSEVVIADGPKSRPEQRKRNDDLGGRDEAGCGVSPNQAVTLLGNGDFAKVDGDGLFHNQTAGNAITCIAGWIRLHVVALRMMFYRWMHEHQRLKQVSWIRVGWVELLRGGTTLLHLSANVDPVRMRSAFHEIRKFVDHSANDFVDDASVEQARFDLGRHYNLGVETSAQAALRALLVWRLDWPLDAERESGLGGDRVVTP